MHAAKLKLQNLLEHDYGYICHKWTQIMNVSLTKKQEDYISEQIASGDYQNASELVRDALRLHELYRDKVIQDLKSEIQKGLESGYSDRSIMDIINSEID